MQKIELEIVRGCPLQCRWCPIIKEDYHFMSLEFLERIFAEVVNDKVGREKIRLTGRGEPTLYPDFLKMLEYLSDMKIAELTTTEIITNGVFLSEKISQAIAESGAIREVVASVDGFGTKESYEYCRPGAEWETVVKNVNQLYSLVKKAGTNVRCRLEVILPQAGSIPEEFEPERANTNENLARAFPGIPYQTRGIHRYDGQIIKEGMPENSLAGSRDEKSRGICLRVSWNWVTVLWDGLVSICCNDANGQTIIGDLNHQSIRSFWHSKQARQVRRDLYLGRTHKYKSCSTCDILLHDRAEIRRQRVQWIKEDYVKSLPEFLFHFGKSMC